MKSRLYYIRAMIFPIIAVFFTIITIILNTNVVNASESGCSAVHWEFPIGGSSAYNNPAIIKEYTMKSSNYVAGSHRGLDFDAAEGESIIAPADGKITWKGKVAGAPTVTVTHGTLKSTFQPASTELKAGDDVHKDQSFATVTHFDAGQEHCLKDDEATGNNEGENSSETIDESSPPPSDDDTPQNSTENSSANVISCLHWGVVRVDNSNAYVDPKKQVYRKDVVLKR